MWEFYTTILSLRSNHIKSKISLLWRNAVNKNPYGTRLMARMS